MRAKLLGEITAIEVIAEGSSIRGRRRFEKAHGGGRWRKLKGIALVELPDGFICHAEVRRYEAHGIGRRDLKVKRLLER